ncbi:MAG: T9SS type A sorting domain-containing protein, partial [Bacteroidota bacterium]
VDNLAFSGTVAVVQPPINVGIRETQSQLSHISLFPNPSNGAVSIQYNLLSPEKVTLRVIDITGKLVREIVALQSTTGTNSMAISTTGLAKGQYTVIISTNHSAETKKLMVE